MKKTCVITGGSSGIGLSCVEAFLSDGYDVFNLDLIPSQAGHFCECDITDLNKVRSTIADIAEQQNRQRQRPTVEPEQLPVGPQC